MTRREERAARLQGWILVEAYKNGLARVGGVCGSRGSNTDGSEQYFVCRQDIYQRYFRLPIDASLQGAGNRKAFRRHARLRLRSTTIVCESVRQLVRHQLIHFPQLAFAQKSHDDLLRIPGTVICLTLAGVAKAQSLLSAVPEQACSRTPAGERAARPPLKPRNAAPLTAC